jgi:hypothetical protein
MPRKKRSYEERERNLDQEFRLWEALASFTERFKGESMSAADMAGRLTEHLGFEITPSAVERAAKAVGVKKLIDPRSERRRSRVEAARLEKEVELLTARVAELERQLAAAQPAKSVGIEITFVTDTLSFSSRPPAPLTLLATESGDTKEAMTPVAKAATNSGHRA